MSYRKARLSGALLAGTVLLAGCDTGPTAPPDRASLSISDGAHLGNPHFFFLPSMVPKMPSTSGTFDPRYSGGLVYQAQSSPPPRTAVKLSLAAESPYTTTCAAGFFSSLE